MANPNAPDGINVSFRHGAALLEGSVQLFPGTRAVVMMLPDGTAGRRAPDASFLESAMNRAGFATLTFGALTASEEAQDARDFRYRFDVDLLVGRTVAAVDFITTFRQTTGLPLGLLGIGIGASAALGAAAQRPDLPRAVVSVRGRTDMAWSSLARVQVPTLLVVGEKDTRSAVLNEMAARAIPGETSYVVIPGAGRYLDEVGALQAVADLASSWFERHLVPVPVG
ncbi:MAG: hypothetical protein FJ314_05505 [SAR202 cluster bacterium]|nr:hypothetical protein [SAR202 cluster bacterium]